LSFCEVTLIRGRGFSRWRINFCDRGEADKTAKMFWTRPDNLVKRALTTPWRFSPGVQVNGNAAAELKRG
jgi:hypothetical protein